jgi:hypothetical protein
MLAALLPGLRNLRIAFVSGALIVASLYVLFGERLFRDITLRSTARDILDLSPIVPVVLLALACGLIGSLYVTALEGLVDWVHRKTIFSDETRATKFKRRWLKLVMPLSPSAKSRITAEAGLFYDDMVAKLTAAQQASTAPRDRFVKQVALDVLWLEGKLAGTPLEAPYDQFRSEGEFRLATSLLLPITVVAALHAIHAPAHIFILILVPTTMVALKLADYGLYYYRKAHSFLAHHIADGQLFTPAMEGLARHDREKRRGQANTTWTSVP